MASTPQVKFESPAESLVDSFATPSAYSLFDPVDPSRISSPQAYDEDSMFGDGSLAGTPAPEKKQVKKRKSWGQQLPEPKTNLPPRKRAKTEDEKEQRRVERVLRNRRAAQSSRERKRQEVEALEAEKKAVEQRNADLELRLAEMEARNTHLQQQLEQITGGKMQVFQGSSVASTPATEKQPSTPVTFSQELFPQINRTVNPASLSPEIKPVVESNASSSALTQHPAAVLCDLQCQTEEQRPWNSTITRFMMMAFLVNTTSAAISNILGPLTQIMISLRTGSSLSPTDSILQLIIWMVTTTSSLKNTTLTTSSTKMNTQPRFSLRIQLLRRLLACSPNLARPLMDATMVAMRSASEQLSSDHCLSEGYSHGEKPRVEVLMTLLWAISVISKEESKDRKQGWELTGRGGAYSVETLGKKSLDDWRTAYH